MAKRHRYKICLTESDVNLLLNGEHENIDRIIKKIERQIMDQKEGEGFTWRIKGFDYSPSERRERGLSRRTRTMNPSLDLSVIDKILEGIFGNRQGQDGNKGGETEKFPE